MVKFDKLSTKRKREIFEMLPVGFKTDRVEYRTMTHYVRNALTNEVRFIDSILIISKITLYKQNIEYNALQLQDLVSIQDMSFSKDVRLYDDKGW